MARFPRLFLSFLCAPLVLGACATVSDAPLQQQVELHAVLDYQEVSGVGCLLSNNLGRWFVVAPGRVTIARSAEPLVVSCKKAGIGMGQEAFGSRPDAMSLMGNVVISAGMGIAVDKYSGASWAYPANLTVLMTPAKPPAELAAAERVQSPVF
ncbi:hypothetical protein MasN3_17690 [Massilia varians]|uniref:Lipoprotein n=1 Tax=Massilia varians TaxID=457921 RepID=A0ABM8C4Y4_9BURK|nr:hypothetical protein [Massilia varians]BDT58275.1 hypothetical protein MasN3_17690 [Massilia varians]